MKALSWRLQLGFIGTAYAAVTLFSALLVFLRYLQYVNHPDDAMASSGMYAFGDELLGIFIFFLFLIPTVFLLGVMGNFEGAYTRYSQVVFAVALTAPLCLGAVYVLKLPVASDLEAYGLIRLIHSPLLFLVMAVSRWWAKFDLAKRFCTRALLLEGGTFAIGLTLVLTSWRQG